MAVDRERRFIIQKVNWSLYSKRISAVSRFQITCRPLGFPMMTRSTFSLTLFCIVLYSHFQSSLRIRGRFEIQIPSAYRVATDWLLCTPPTPIRLMQCARFVLLFRRSCDRSLDAPAVQYHLLPPVMLVSDRPFSFECYVVVRLVTATYVYPVI